MSSTKHTLWNDLAAYKALAEQLAGELDDALVALENQGIGMDSDDDRAPEIARERAAELRATLPGTAAEILARLTRSTVAPSLLLAGHLSGHKG